MKPAVLIWRSELLPPSETFIAAQSRALQRYTPQIIGLRSVRPSLPLESPLLPRVAPRLQRLLAREAAFAPLLLRQARSAGAALVHAHFACDACEALPLVRHLALPLLVTLHGYDVMRTNPAHVATRRGRRYLAQRPQLWEYVTTFICVSEAIRRTAILRGFPAHKLRLLPIGIDTSLYTARAVTPREPTILFIGRLVPKKGCDTLITAMGDVQRTLPDARLLIVGEGPERARLEALARVQTRGTAFLGRQSSTQIRALLQAVRCLAAPSCTAADGDGEGLPTVLLEALAMAVPVASTQHSGIPELITHGETGLLCPERTIEMLARNLTRLCTDDALCAELAAAGRRRVEDGFEIHAQTRELEAIYDEAVSAAPAGSRLRGEALSAVPAQASVMPGSVAARQALIGQLEQPRPALPVAEASAARMLGIASAEPPLRRQAAWLLSGNGASMMFQALAFVLIGRMLGAREYGAFIGSVALIQVLAQFSSLGMDIVLLRTIARDRTSFAAAWFRALVIASAGSLVLLAAVVGWGSVFLPAVVRPLLISLALADGLAGRVTQMASRALQADGQVRWSAKLLAATNLARCVAAGVLLLYASGRGGVTLAGWAHAYLLASAAVALLAIGLVTHRMGLPVRSRITRAHLLEGLSFSFSNSAISIYNDVDKTVLMQQGMLYAAGIYGAAYRVIDVATAPLVSLFGAASPGLFRAGAAGGAATVQPQVRRLLRWTVPLGIGIAAVLALFAPVIPHIFGRSFAGSIAVLRWLCLLPLLRGLHYAWGTGITACTSQWPRTAAQAGVALLNLVLNLCLVPRWGWQAAAAISLVSDGTLALVSWLILRALVVRQASRSPVPPGGRSGPALGLTV